MLLRTTARRRQMGAEGCVQKGRHSLSDAPKYSAMRAGCDVSAECSRGRCSPAIVRLTQELSMGWPNSQLPFLPHRLVQPRRSAALARKPAHSTAHAPSRSCPPATTRMARCLVATIAAVLVLMAASAHARGLQQAAAVLACPVDPASVDIDFSNVARSCAGEELCTTCVCSLVSVFAPAMAAGGVTYDPAAPASFPLDQAADILRVCSEQYLVPMLQANVNITALAGLEACSFTSEAEVPACLPEAVASLAAPANVTAASRIEEDADLSSVALPSASGAELRVATVQAGTGTAGGPVFTLAGTLLSAGQLLDAMAASQAFREALTPEQAAKLAALAANAAAIDDNPAAASLLGQVANPVDGVALLTALDQLAQGQAPADLPQQGGAPAAAAMPAPVAAPAPAQSSAAGLAASATVAAVLFAVLLMA